MFSSAPSMRADACALADSTCRLVASISSLMSAATVELTVEKNASLMVVSSEFAPVSVILGDTGPVFSFT